MDKIHLNNGLIIDGTITQIGLETVTIRYGDKDLTRTLHKDAIKVIIYEGGTAETFQKKIIKKPDIAYDRFAKYRYAKYTKRKSPALAVTLSIAGGAFLPIQGLGQYYNGENLKGTSFLGIGLLSYVGLLMGIVSEDRITARSAAIIYLGSWVWSTVDSGMSATRINRNIRAKINNNGDGFMLSYSFSLSR